MDRQDWLSECKKHISIKATSYRFLQILGQVLVLDFLCQGFQIIRKHGTYKFKKFTSVFTVICWKVSKTFFLFERPWILMISNSLYHISLHYQFFVPYFFTLPFLCTSLENALKKFSFLLTKLALCMHISGKFCLFFKLTLPCRFCFLGPNASR